MCREVRFAQHAPSYGKKKVTGAEATLKLCSFPTQSTLSSFTLTLEHELLGGGGGGSTGKLNCAPHLKRKSDLVTIIIAMD